MICEHFRSPDPFAHGTGSPQRCPFCGAGLSAVMESIPDSANVVGPNWFPSKYGPDDQIGAANLVTPASVVQALSLVKHGNRVSLGLELNTKSPGTPPRRFDHYLIENLGTNHSNGDDFINGSLNSGTNIDGLGHLGVQGVFYNGRIYEDIFRMDGLRSLGIERVPPLFCRGIVLDIVAVRGRRLNGGEVVTRADLEAAAKRQNISFAKVDIVLIHTGWLELWREGSDLFWQQEPGAGIEAATFLAEEVGVVAVGGDSSRLEADPHERVGLFFPVHQILLAKNGCYIIENVQTQLLVDACISEFCLAVVPLPVTGASVTWVNPVALW
jgi:kynurenine formamidase